MPSGVYIRKPFTEIHKKRISETLKGKMPKFIPNNTGRKRPDVTGDKNPNWKGDKVSYSGIHYWVRKHKPIPKRCVDCGKIKKLQAANISGKYKRDLNDWEYLCARCHIYKDGTINNLKH